MNEKQKNIELEPLNKWEPDVVKLLKSIYLQVDRKHITWDVYASNIRSAAAKHTIPEFLDTLCRKVGIGLPAESTDVNLIRRLFPYTDEVLAALRETTNYYVLAVREEM
jgi:hypothetical protein